MKVGLEGEGEEGEEGANENLKGAEVLEGGEGDAREVEGWRGRNRRQERS